MSSSSVQAKIESKIRSGAETYSSAIGSASNYHNWILEEFRPYLGSSVMEVGLGHGNYRNCLHNLNSYTGIDIDQESIMQAKEKFPQDRFVCVDITSDKFTDVMAEKYDSVICINVIEHIENDAKAVQNLLSVLRPQGFLLLFVPAFESLYNDLDSLAGHHRRYHLHDSKRLLKGLNCRLVENKYFNPIGGLGWYVNKFAKHKSLNENAVNNQIVLFDRYILPISRMLNPLTKQLFGQSLITVVQKND